jgi:hypothetical protein
MIFGWLFIAGCSSRIKEGRREREREREREKVKESNLLERKKKVQKKLNLTILVKVATLMEMLLRYEILRQKQLR